MRREKINAMKDLFREIFEVRFDGRIVYKTYYKIEWLNLNGYNFKEHFKGEVFGKNQHKRGHWCAGFHGVKMLKEHQVSWLLTHDFLPEGGLEIDHLDGNPENNAPSNLRAATKSLNQQNCRVAKGYSWHSGRWQAKICLNREQIHLGSFDTELDARAAYIRGKREYHPDCGLDIFQKD